jgi:hypothetical protein
MSFKLPIHDPSHKGKDPKDATCQQVLTSGAHAQAQESTAHSNDTQVLGEDVTVQEDLEDCESSDSDSNFVSSTDTSDTESDTDSDDSFNDFDEAGSGEHEQDQNLSHHFSAAADASTA